MKSLIRERIISLVVKGLDPENAYRIAVAEVAAKAKAPSFQRDLERSGVKLPRGVEGSLPQPKDLKDVVTKLVIGGGGVEDVPSAACVREKLKGTPSPTRADVQDAMNACRGQ